MEKVAQVFTLMLVGMIGLGVGFCLAISLRPFFMYLMIYWGFSRVEPNYTFPLNYFELKIRVKRLKESGLIKEEMPGANDQDDCVFCLQSKLTIG